MRPFQQLPFEALPKAPRRPHAYFETEALEVPIETPELGRLVVHARAAGSGPPLVCVHGLMTSSYSFRYVVSELSQRFRVFAPDLPGSGRTTAPPGRALSPGAIGRALAAFVDAVGARGAHAIGNSMGGYLSMHAVLDDEALFGALMNVHSPGVPIPRMWALSAGLRAPGAARLLDALIRRSPERWVHENVHYRDDSLKSLEEARVYAEPLTTPAGREGFYRTLRDTLSASAMRAFVERLARRRDGGAGFPVPLTLLYATEDPMVPPEIGPLLAALVPDAELVRITESSHFCHVDTPERFLELAAPFLDRAFEAARG